MTARRRLTAAEKRDVQAKCQGACVDCRSDEGPLDYEHEVPLWKGGKDEVSNVVLRCRGKTRCHGRKTTREAKDRAKEERIHLKQRGGYSHRRKFVKKIDGTVAVNPNAKGRIPW